MRSFCATSNTNDSDSEEEGREGLVPTPLAGPIHQEVELREMITAPSILKKRCKVNEIR